MVRHLFLVNPKAGVRSCAQAMIENIRRACSENPDCKDECFDIVLTQEKGDATRLAKKACMDNPGYTRIYACGGDGTLHEVINGVVGESEVAVCPIPIGSGNDFIRYFDTVSKEAFLDLPAALRGQEIVCDVLRCGDVYSLNNISLGLDAITAKRQSKVKKLPLISGSAAYKLALGYSFFTSMKNPVRFVVDGKELVIGQGDVTLAVFGNGKWYGGGFKATPLASIQDGWMDFCTVPTISRLEFLKYVGDYQKGEHLKTMPKVYYTKCKKIQILADKPVDLQADGEAFCQTNPEIEVVPAAVRLVLPDCKGAETWLGEMVCQQKI